MEYALVLPSNGESVIIPTIVVVAVLILGLRILNELINRR